MLETIFGLFLLSFLIVMVFNLYPSSLLSVRRAEESVQADLLAQSLLDQSTARPFDQLVIGELYQVQQDFKSTRLEATLEVYSVPDAQEELLKRLRVVVAWKARDRDYAVIHECLVPYVNP